MKSTCAAACAGAAAWCSLGALGVTGDSVETRLALLPAWWLLPALIATAVIIVRVARLSPPELSPLFGSALLILPWLPIPLPAVTLVWTGAFAVGVWLAVVAGVIISSRSSARASARPARDHWFTEPSRSPIGAAALAFAMYGGIAWWLAPVLPGGDEPHYLILTQSLLEDGDLRIEDNHQRGDYLEYFPGALKPDYLRRGKDAAIYSIHSPGLPALIAPAFFLGGYPGAVAFLALVGALGTALVWRTGHRATGSVDAAWFGWACSALTAPFVFVAAQIFPDGVGASCVLLGMLPLLDDRRSHWSWLLAGVALAMLPWLHTRFAIISGAAAVCLMTRVRTARQLAIFVAVPLASAAAWFGYFYAIYGTVSPSAPYGGYTQTAAVNLVRGIPGLLFDQQFGLIANAPVYAVVVAGIVVAAARLRRWSWDLLIVAVPYVVAVGMFQMWWGGSSVPARFLTPLTLVLGVAAARIWHDTRSPATRALSLVALGASILITAALVTPGRGRLLFNDRDGFALWLDWANDLIDLPRGLPSLFRDTPQRAWLNAALWVASFAVAWLLLLAIAKRGNDSSSARVRVSRATTWCVAGALMTALSLSWRLDRVQPVTPETAKLRLLRHTTSTVRPLAFDYARWRLDSAPVLLSELRLQAPGRRSLPPGGPLWGRSGVPAGSYRLHIAASAIADGALSLRIGRASPPIGIWRLAGAHSGPLSPPIRLPVDVQSMSIDADDGARRAITGIELEPWFGDGIDEVSANGTARRAARYGTAAAYFMDDGAFAEPGGFWLAGGKAARVVIANAAASLRVFLRNAPVDNLITIEVDGQLREIGLHPREELTVVLPRTKVTRDTVVRFKTAYGIRPWDLDPANLDMRYLGCWVEIR